jgi:hypothetical protein
MPPKDKIVDIRDKANNIGIRISRIPSIPNPIERGKEWESIKSEWRDLIVEIIKTTKMADTKNNSVKKT